MFVAKAAVVLNDVDTKLLIEGYLYFEDLLIK